MALGTVLAAFPGRRRRPTDPVSAPVGDVELATEPPRATAATPVDDGVPDPVFATEAGGSRP
jgi:hypothetical protein